MDRQWISITPGAEEGALPMKVVEESGLEALRDLALDQTRRMSTRVSYQLGGGWKGTFQHAGLTYDTISVPGAVTTSEEGKPEIPQDVLPVAIPNEATNVTVEVVHKEMQPVPGVWKLRPAPNWVTEEEYLAGRERYRSEPEVYDSDDEYPGKDLEFLGLRVLEGVTVAHIIVYLAQYKPKSGTLAMVEAMTLEVSYDVPPGRDALPRRRRVRPLVSDLILDSESIQEEVLDVQPFPDKEGAALKRTDIVSEYVIVTDDSLETAVAPLLRAKSGSPYHAMLATTQTIRTEFPAASLRESLRAFLLWAWDYWHVPPRYVVLAGDSDTIPVHLFTVRGTTYASDHYYADTRDSFAPEIVVSRIPTSDAGTMRQVCQRLANYPNLRGPDRGEWQKEVVLVAYQDQVYQSCSDDIASAISSRFKVTKLYGDSSTRQQVVDKMNSGVLIANYRGHGSKIAWSSRNGLRTREIRGLNNESRPPMVLCICCKNAWIDDRHTETVVETFLREGKAVAVLGASRNSPTRANNDFDTYLFQAITDHGEATPGRIVLRAKTMMVLNHPKSVPHRLDVAMYMLFGDPTAVLAASS
jgi:hypothetical protein